MPATTAIDPANDKQREEALKELRARREMIDEHWRYYEGKFKVALQREKDSEGNLGPDFNVYLPLCTESVDATRDYFVPDMPTVQLDDERTTSPDEELIRDTLRDNGDETLLHQIFMQGATSGHCFVRVVPPDQNVKGAFTRLVPLDSRQVVIWWSDDDKDDILGYELYWGQADNYGGPDNFKYRQLVIKIAARDENSLNFRTASDFWVVIDYEKVGNIWHQMPEAEWPYEYGPIVSWPHLPPLGNGVYGQHEFGAKHLNDEANFYTSNIKKINAFHGHPRTVVTGVSDIGDIQAGPGRLLTISKSDAKVVNVEMLSDLSSMRDERDQIINRFFRYNKVVRISRDEISTGKMTNFAVQLLFEPMDKKNRLLQNNYGQQGLVPLTRRVLMLNGRAGYEDVQPRIEWPMSLPVNMVEQIAVESQELALGLTSRRNLVEKRGRDFEMLEQERAAEAAAVEMGFGYGTEGMVA